MALLMSASASLASALAAAGSWTARPDLALFSAPSRLFFLATSVVSGMAPLPRSWQRIELVGEVEGAARSDQTVDGVVEMRLGHLEVGGGGGEIGMLRRGRDLLGGVGRQGRRRGGHETGCADGDEEQMG